MEYLSLIIPDIYNTTVKGHQDPWLRRMEIDTFDTVRTDSEQILHGLNKIELIFRNENLFLKSQSLETVNQ